MLGLTPDLMILVGALALVVHVASVMLACALRSYSRTLLEERLEERGLPGRADEIAHLDGRTEQAAEVLAVLSGFILAALIGVMMERWESPASLVWVAFAVLVLAGVGDLVASVLGRVYAEPIIDRLWPATAAIRLLARPVDRLAGGLERLIGKLASGAERNPRPASVEVEIPTEDGESTEDVEADLSDEARDLLQRALELSRMDVSQLMIPASSIVSLPQSVTATTAAETFRSSGRSRIPIFGANRDDIVGILLGKDLWERLVDSRDPASVIPARLVRPALRVPETANALALIEELRKNRTQMAIVIDEYGGVAGLVTLEDLLEQLVGPIEDEHDVPPAQDPIKPVGGSRYELDAAVILEELNEKFDLHLPTEEDFETVGGLALHALGRLPERGATFRHGGIEFTVLDIRGRSIRRVLIDLEPTSTMADGKG